MSAGNRRSIESAIPAMLWRASACRQASSAWRMVWEIRQVRAKFSCRSGSGTFPRIASHRNAGSWPSSASTMSSTVMFSGRRAKGKPPRGPETDVQDAGPDQRLELLVQIGRREFVELGQPGAVHRLPRRCPRHVDATVHGPFHATAHLHIPDVTCPEIWVSRSLREAARSN